MGMTRKHQLLKCAVMAAMAEQQISQNTLARKCGVGQSMISAAFLDKYELKEEKWRLICEALGLDYDAIVDGVVEEPDSSVSPQADYHLPQVGEGKESAAPVEETRGVQMFSVMQKSVLPSASRTWRTCFCWRCMPRADLPRTSKAA